MVNLKALERAITQIETLRDLEYSFEIGDLRITLRALSPDQETEVQKFSLPKGAEPSEFPDFFDRMRWAALGFAIVQIGDLDLRNEEYIETDEKTAQGLPVSVPKWEAIRDMIRNEWSKTMLTQVFDKYAELINRIEIQASKRIKYDPVDVSSEIERLNKRLRELQDIQKKTTSELKGSPPVGPKPETAQSAVSRAQAAVEVMEQEVHSIVGNTASSTVQEPTTGRRSAIPTQAPPPAQTPPAQTPVQDEANQTQVPQEMVDRQGIPLPSGGDSFFDPSNPEEAIAAENRRQEMLLRQNMQRQAERKQQEAAMHEAREEARNLQRQNQQKPPGGAVRLDDRTGGLRAAANTHNVVLDSGVGNIRTGRPQPQPKSLDGRPVYKMPTETLSRSPTKTIENVSVDPEGNASRNPRFRPPQG